ncbi:unnamed protein product [Porites evermanni]|uniref:FERM domain-containing protein n=1 Tax=Porites evermanni TaxID=104178 RepID=A0ABN8M4G9_9CNID|nr:unnamed protein product [Porites evermanni]
MSFKFLRASSSVIECHVVLLDNSEFVTMFDQETVVGDELFERVCERLKVPSYDRQYFGLQYIDNEDGDVNWLNLDKEIRPPRKSNPLMYQFAVKVFPFLGEVNLVLYVFLSPFKLDGHSFVASIDGFFAQAMLGDFIPKQHKAGYLETLLGIFYCPPTGINCDGDIDEEKYELMVRDLHRSHRGMTREKAVSYALDICKELPNYGACVYYGGTDLDSGDEVVLSVSIQGIRICQLKNKFPEVGEVCHHFQWRDVISILCDDAKLYVHLAEAANGNEEDTSCRAFRFKKGLYSHKVAHRFKKDAENHQNFFFEENPERARTMRSLSVDVKSLKGIRNLRSGSVGSGRQFLASKMTLPFKRQTTKK